MSPGAWASHGKWLRPVLHRNAKVFVKSFRTAFSRSKTRGLKKLWSRSNSALFPYCTGFSKVSKGLLVCSHVGTGISTKFESGTVCLCVDTTEIFVETQELCARFEILHKMNASIHRRTDFTTQKLSRNFCRRFPAQKFLEKF